MKNKEFQTCDVINERKITFFQQSFTKYSISRSVKQVGESNFSKVLN